jgi:four helix bundle protein
MPTIRRFEDIEVWQKARKLTNSIYELTNRKYFNHDFNLRDQMRRASISVMLNIAEGFGRKTDKEFSRFLTQAHGSAAEIQSALYIAIDQGYINQEEFNRMYRISEDVSKMIMNFLRYLLNKRGLSQVSAS